MGDFKLSKRSMDNYLTLHEDLRRIIDVALKCSQVDFVVVEGHRSIERQQQLFKEGKTKIDGINKKGKHNEYPSMAFDFCAVAKNPYHEPTMMYLVGVFTSIGEALRLTGDVSHRVRSGANWDMDGELLTDQTFIDMPHIEIVK